MDSKVKAKIYLLAHASALALTIAAAPLALSLDGGSPFTSPQAHADSGEGG